MAWRGTVELFRWTLAQTGRRLSWDLGWSQRHSGLPRGKEEDDNLSPSMTLRRLLHCTGSEGLLRQAGPVGLGYHRKGCLGEFGTVCCCLNTAADQTEGLVKTQPASQPLCGILQFKLLLFPPYIIYLDDLSLCFPTLWVTPRNGFYVATITALVHKWTYICCCTIFWFCNSSLE